MNKANILLGLTIGLNSITGQAAALMNETPPGYAVASAHPLATNAGLEILAAGGNAFDAAVAVSATLAVVEPYHSGLGGGGFWLLYDAKRKKNIVIDGREVAPLAAHKTMFLDQNGQVIPGLSLNGGLAAAIPGEPAALVYIAQHYGRLPLAQTLASAIKFAEQGFQVDAQLHHYSQMTERYQMMQRFPATAAVFLHNNQPYKIGELLKQPDLAKTLKLLAQKGHAGFYSGEIAKKLVNGVRAAGGIWTLADLANYQIKIREPLQGAYHNMLIITMPPPSAGGVMLLTMLNILEGLSLKSLSEAQWIHYLVETMRLAYWQSNQTIADPGFTKIDLNKLLSLENAKQLRTLIPKDKALPSVKLQVNKNYPANHHANTTHISIIDAEGNRVSATLTINYIFGSSVIAPGTGVLLNDEMDDFSAKEGVKNVFGLVGNDINSIEPGKRPMSNMTPTFLEMPGRAAILGTPGGSRIPTMILLSTLLFHDYQGAIAMVSGMRFHHQYLPDWLQFEPETFSPELQNQLKSMGYHLMALKQYYGDMQAITWDKKLNILTAASDPRNIGLAVAASSKQGGYGLDF
ncbi:gamma-glutamyltranspeptidase [Legionella beliardensis]|uniref:Glutathione hydrolase proenzyme n=1 Tax=Legionella beliardensis TaxID=91822 RepID=A0A378I5U2_9GAMM|nr:gamma-glutamyltransferase [Legionella beliardensis]STX30021.1 gamma-glutamyltranspeptidase [Legionella beliardensis]